MIKKVLKKINGKYRCIVNCLFPKNLREIYVDIQEEEFWDLYDSCKPYTMTSVERMYSLYKAVVYVLDNNIPGAFVECGVWRGGSSMMVAKILTKRSEVREIVLYDTFEGMSEPGSMDYNLQGSHAEGLMEKGKHDKENSVWCLADLEDVRNNLISTEYSVNNIRFIKGKVENTIPEFSSETSIALLRLDTDWYESTKHELIHLFPRLSSKGVLIIDDYGHWHGCRKAVDEYFISNNIHMLLQRVDYTGRIGIKE